MKLIKELKQTFSMTEKRELLAKASPIELKVIKYAYDDEYNYYLGKHNITRELGEPTNELFELLDLARNKRNVLNKVQKYAFNNGDLIFAILNKNLDCSVSVKTIQKLHPELLSQKPKPKPKPKPRPKPKPIKYNLLEESEKVLTKFKHKQITSIIVQPNYKGVRVFVNLDYGRCRIVKTRGSDIPPTVVAELKKFFLSIKKTYRLDGVRFEGVLVDGVYYIYDFLESIEISYSKRMSKVLDFLYYNEKPHNNCKLIPLRVARNLLDINDCHNTYNTPDGIVIRLRQDNKVFKIIPENYCELKIMNLAYDRYNRFSHIVCRGRIGFTWVDSNIKIGANENLKIGSVVTARYHSIQKNPETDSNYLLLPSL